MTASLPRVRADLAFTRQLSADGDVFIVKDLVRRQFYRFREAENFIIGQLDGATSVEVVRQRVEQKFGGSLTAETLNGFVSRLDRAKLLESGKCPARPSRRLSGSLLYLRYKLFDPERLFNWMIGKVRFFFTAPFLVLSAISIIAATVVAITGWQDAVADLSRLYRLSAIPLIMLVVFLVVGAHEFAHGLTCKHFGGEVREIGFFLVYFQPALYCNVSDAWLFPEKSKRLWVGFAGPYFELFLWSVATLLWRLTEIDTGINYIALIIMTTSGIKTLFNFNPLIKLDGYYLLSDWLEMPNLRRRAFAYIGQRFKRIFGVGEPVVSPLPLRERRIYLLYGSLAAVGSFSIIAFAMAKLGDYFVNQTQPMALAVFTGLLGMKVRQRYRRLFGKSSGDPEDMDDDDFPETEPTSQAPSSRPSPPEGEKEKTALALQPSAPEGEKAALALRPSSAEGEKEKTALALRSTPSEGEKAALAPRPSSPDGEREKIVKAPKRKKKRKVYISWRKAVAVLFAGGVVALLVYGHSELKIGGPLAVLPIHNADVRSQVEGIIEKIPVDEGDVVKEGDLIARLADRDCQAELGKNRAALEEARAHLNLLKAGARSEEILLSKTLVAKAEERLAFASSRVERDKSLFQQRLLSTKDFEDSEAYLADRQNEANEATGKLKVLLAGCRPEEIEAVQAEIARLDAQRVYLEEQLTLLKVVSPASGTVATPSRHLKEMRHQLVKKGDLIAKVYELKTITAEIVVSEKDIADVKLGQQVMLKARAYPELTFLGKVTSIATAAQGSAATAASALPSAPTILTRDAIAIKNVLVTTEIDNSSLLLKPEMTGQAKILCGDRRIWDLLTRRIARTLKVQFWSWW